MEESLQTIKGVGPSRERQFHKLGITNVSSLLTYFPRTYEDRTKIYPIGTIDAGTVVSVTGVIVHVSEKKPRRRLSILEVFIDDGTGKLKLTFFNQGYKKNYYKVGQHLHAYGKVEFSYGSKQMNSPQIEHIDPNKPIESGIIPVYPLVDGVPQFVVRQAVKNWFQNHNFLEPILPSTIIDSHKFMSRYEAFKEMHFPTSMEIHRMARHQLAFEELFIMQTGLLLLRREVKHEKGYAMRASSSLVSQCIKKLPFQLTGDQKKAFQDIVADMEQETPMQRLVQGDVGSGKTVVALLSLLKAVENGYQGALMAPTEILGTQHFENFYELCTELGIRMGLLTGSMKESEKKLIQEQVRTGEIQIVIGTHALIQEKVEFHKLGIVIIDEQHRFGVEQRAKLQRKSKAPHMLIMTATPIPRTLTLSIYGDLEVSLIKEMPPGRKPIKTYAVNSSYKKRLLQFYKKEMDKGHQVYVVCPLVEESEKLDLKAAEELYLELASYFNNAYRIGLVHGKMKSVDKEEIMNDFHEGKIQLLVSTTVIEVGVNVPNATIMCVEGAERFGLSQLHQLRGRVGRGSSQGYCVLVSDSKNPDTKTRLQLMESTQDGFELAEQDLLLRGSGQLFGLAQSGLPDLKVANIIHDIDILIEARKAAIQYMGQIEGSPLPDRLQEEIKNRFGSQFLGILYS